MARVRQDFPRTAAINLRATLEREFVKIRGQIKAGDSIAIGSGSRGISNIAEIVRTVVDLVKGVGANPFIFPAMGSHGGATPEGQTEVLASYGITEATMGAPIRASMEVRRIGMAPSGAPVFASEEAMRADGILLVNRVKPHTDFFGELGSGIIKMAVIGLGKKEGAAAMHIRAARFGHEKIIREMAHLLLCNTPILGGVAILENQFHETAAIEIIPREQIEAREPALLREARRMMPLLPFDEIDLLIIDRIGKNISGAGLDPNVVGRGVQGYVGGLAREGRPSPFVRRIFVRDLTPETHGNAIGIGNADITTTRLVTQIDRASTYVNAFTALSLQSAKIPIHFETDRECLERVLASLALDDVSAARVVRIRDTLALEEMEVSESLASEVKRQSGLVQLTKFSDLEFGGDGNLRNL